MICLDVRNDLLSRNAKPIVAAIVALSTHLVACEGGCPSNAEPAPTSCPSNPPSYLNDVAPILSQACSSCHGPDGEESSVPLDTYQDVFQERTIVQVQIESCAMPQGGSLSSAQRSTLLTWLACGAPDN